MNRSVALVLLATACTTNARPEAVATPSGGDVQSAAPLDAVVTDAPAQAHGTWAAILPDGSSRELAAVGNLERVPGLTDEHRAHLTRDGFFVTAQAAPVGSKTTSGAARMGRRARHLFQVYERNDYIRFPSYVTVDLSIDLTHQYFDVVLRKLEREHLVPKLAIALRGAMNEAVRMRDAAKSPKAKKAAQTAAVYWGTALRLLEQPAAGDQPDVVAARAPWYDDPEFRAEMGDSEGDPPPQPKIKITTLDRAITREVDRAVQQVVAAAGKHEFSSWGQTLDLTLARPRSHYAASGVLQRYFRAMTLLGLSSFAVEGDDARPEFLTALALSLDGATKAKAAYIDVLQLTNYVVGEPPTAGLVRAAEAVRAAVGAKGLDAAIEPTQLAAITKAWTTFPKHPVAGDRPVVQPIGQRVFVDTLAMAKLLPVINALPPGHSELVARAMGAVGSAAMLGSDPAQAIVVAAAGDQHEAVARGITSGRALVGDLSARPDAYHGTLNALQASLNAAPLWFAPKAQQLRMLSTYAGGWALLRHDTLLYAYQMGAECDAEELTSPYAWVEPYPEVYTALRDMVTGFERRLKRAGVAMTTTEEDEYDGKYSIGTKTTAVVAYLDQMIAWSNKELSGESFTEDERQEIAMVGGRAEHVVLTLADAFELGAGNEDMAVVADVFTFGGQALEVAVAHPELIYAVIPTPKGWTLARGAVMGYREFFVDSSQRMTDEAWRERLGASKDFEASTRPPWLGDISAAPVGVIALPPDGKGQTRCEYFGGQFEL